METKENPAGVDGEIKTIIASCCHCGRTCPLTADNCTNLLTWIPQIETLYRKKIRAEVCEEFFKVMRSQICYCGDGWCDKPSCETMEDRLKYMEKVKKEISKAREGKDGK